MKMSVANWTRGNVLLRAQTWTIPVGRRSAQQPPLPLTSCHDRIPLSASFTESLSRRVWSKVGRDSSFFSPNVEADLVIARQPCSLGSRAITTLPRSSAVCLCCFTIVRMVILIMICCFQYTVGVHFEPVPTLVHSPAVWKRVTKPRCST